MKVTVITAFPGLFDGFLKTSIIGRAVTNGLLDVRIVDLRDFGVGNYRQVDDYSFGAGGMVLMPGPLGEALDTVGRERGEPFVAYPSPQGAALTQEMIENLASRTHVCFLCGHYEGIDERISETRVDLEFSIGDCVLTGGEIPVMAVIDAMARLVPGVVGRSEAVSEDSFYRGMLDHPHYTRPAVWEGREAPPVLASGNDALVNAWRRRQAVTRTLSRRPDLLGRADIRPYLSHGVYVALVHHPVRDRDGQKTTAALTGLDVSDVCRSCRTYGVDRLLVVTPLPSQREMLGVLTRHWTEGYGGQHNPDRAKAFALVKSVATLERAVRWIREKEKKDPCIVGTSAANRADAVPGLEAKRMILERDEPVLFVFGTAHGLHDDAVRQCTMMMTPLSGGRGEYNHLAVRSAVAVVLDRFFGWR